MKIARKRIACFCLMIAAIGVCLSLTTSAESGEKQFITTPMVIANDGSSICLKNDGTVWTWGLNRFGELGNGTQLNQSLPVQVNGLDHVIRISSGYHFSLALKDDGTVWAWGKNDYGQLGDGTQINRLSPVQVKNLDKVEQIIAERGSSIAIKSDGSVWAWGFNKDGELGDGTKMNQSAPIQIQGIKDIRQINICDGYSIALSEDGKVYTWGTNKQYTLGDNSNKECLFPQYVSNLDHVISIAVKREGNIGKEGVYVLKDDGSVWAWGMLYSNDTRSIIAQPIPTQKTTISGATEITAYPAVITRNGEVWAETFSNDKYVYWEKKISSIESIIDISNVSGYVAALGKRGNVWTWGDNLFGQLGDGSTDNRNEARKVPVLPSFENNKKKIESIAAGPNHVLAISSDGTLWAWGNNFYGELGDGTQENRLTPILVKDSTGDYNVYPNKPLESIKIEGFSIPFGETKTIALVYTPEDTTDDCTAIWASSNEEVAIIADGVLTAKKPGTVTITAKVGNLQASCSVRVTVRNERCPDCHGEGIVYDTCSNCNGRGKWTETKTCSNCRGTGRKTITQIEKRTETCGICHGTGLSWSDSLQMNIPCQFCNATGTFSYEETVTKEIACSTCSGLGFTSINKTCNYCYGEGKLNIYTCRKCNGTGTLEISHKYKNWEETTAPTCIKQGEERRTCIYCDEIERRQVPALGHTWDDGVVTVEPTKEAEGEKTFTCTRCGQTRTEPVPKIVPPDDPKPGLPCDGGDACPGRVFTDMPAKGNWAHDAIDWAVVNQITSGTSKTTFSPETGCTRGQVVTFLWRAAGSPEPTNKTNPFSDVKEGTFYYKAVLWAVENGITNGTSKTTFSPDDTCTRGQIVTFLWRFEGSPSTMVQVNPFADVKSGAYYENAVLWAVSREITNGTSKTAFSPDSTCTRAQVVTFLYRDITEE